MAAPGSVNPAAPKPPGGNLPATPTAPATPAVLSAPATPATKQEDDAKKVTSKVQISVPVKPSPQATVKIGPAAPAEAPAAAIKPAAGAVEAEEDKFTPILAIAATLVALASLGIQLWMFF
jgi:hypothetical protein